jgi:N-acetylglucosaminyl-diphospho-decaprenol L-rhamnosyltransferase
MDAGTERMTGWKPIGEGTPDPAIMLSIIISCYNTRELLADCLRSIYRNPPSESYEIIVVDDASADDTVEMVRTTFPEVRLLQNAINRHYAFSNNRAFDHARGQYVLLLNNDTIVLPQALDDMVGFLQAHPEAGVVGCKLLNDDGTIQWSVKSLPNPASALFGARSFISRMFPGNRFSRRHLLHLDQDMTQPFIAEAGYVSSASSMMPRNIIDEVGYLDTRFAYHVDADYCKRIADAGYKCFYLPTATIIHLNHRGGTMASPQVRLRSLMMFEVQSYLFYRKHVQRSTWSPMQVVVAVGLFFHFLILSAGQVYAELAAVARAFSQQQGRRGEPREDNSAANSCAVSDGEGGG